MAYNPIISRRQQQRNSRPGLSSLSNNQPAKGTSIVMVGGDPNKTYTYVPQSDYQTISYSDTMKKKADEYTQSKSTGERIAGTVYREVDKAATAYEDFISPVTKTFDISTPANTGRPVQDFLANAGRGFINAFVSAPADIARLTGASGLSVAMLGKADTAKKGAEIVASGVPNFAGAQVESFKANPGAFAGGVAAGVVGGKAVGKVASVGKKSIGGAQKAVNSRENAKTVTKTNTVDSRKPRWTRRTSNKLMFSTKSNRPTPEEFVEMGIDRGIIKVGKQNERQKQLISKLGIDDTQMPYIIRRTSTAVERAGAAGRSIGGNSPIAKAPFTRAKTKTTSLITAEQARKPQNLSAAERARVRRVVEAQKKSGAYKTSQRKKREPTITPSKKTTALVTAKDARTPKNKSRKEQIRVSRIVQAQREAGALPANIRFEGGNIRLTSGKPTRAEVKVGKIVSAKVNGKSRILTGKTRSQLKGEAQTRRQRLTRPKPAQSGPKSTSRKDVRKLQNTKQKQNTPRKPSTIRRGPVKSAAERRIEANLRSKLSRELERGGVADTLNQAEMVLRNLPKAPQSERVRVRSTNAQRQNSGPGTDKKPVNTGRKTADGKTIFRDTDGTEFVEVDAGNGMMYKVRVKPQETRTQTAAKSTTQKRKTTSVQKKQTVRRPQSKSTDKSSAPKPVRETRGAATRTRPATGQKKTLQKRQVVRVVSGGPVSASGGQQNVLVLDTEVIADMDIDDTLIDSSVIETDDTTVTQNSSTKPAVVTQTRVSSSVKSAQKEESGTTGTPRARGKPKPAPAVRPKKKPKPVKSIEEDKKKQRKKIKKMKEEAYRLETVNTFAWITDTKPAAKPRRIK